MDVEVLFSFMDTLRTALIQFVHYVPFMSKAPAMWSLSVLRVLLLARCPALTLATQNRETVRRIWASHHTCILLSFFQSQCVVYVRMPFHPPDLKRRWYSESVHVYVGSTAISAAKREFNRFAKLKQVQNQAVHVELSIRYWGSRTDFDS